MTRWERIELALSRLHTRLGGEPDDEALMNEYGKGRIFRERLATLRQKAQRYFIRNSNQAVEAQFGQLADACEGFSARRNDIAHGIAFRIDNIQFFRQILKPSLLHRPHYAIIPPLHAYRLATKQGYPAFAYTSREMRQLAKRLLKIEERIEAFIPQQP